LAGLQTRIEIFTGKFVFPSQREYILIFTGKIGCQISSPALFIKNINKNIFFLLNNKNGNVIYLIDVKMIEKNKKKQKI
jgi:hypothetical protein